MSRQARSGARAQRRTAASFDLALFAFAAAAMRAAAAAATEAAALACGEIVAVPSVPTLGAAAAGGTLWGGG